MRRISLLAGVLFVALSVALSACGGGGGGSGGQQFTVTAVEFKFDPANITVKVNQEVQVTLQNKGTVAHNWTVLGLDSNITTGNVDPGKSGSVTFTPTKTGTFKLECTVPGHAEQGMVGQLTVQ